MGKSELASLAMRYQVYLQDALTLQHALSSSGFKIRCLRSPRTGVSVATFFHGRGTFESLIKTAGLVWGTVLFAWSLGYFVKSELAVHHQYYIFAPERD